MHAMHRWIAVALVLGAAASCAAWQDRDPEPRKVAVQIWVIRATTRNSDVSPELRSIAERLRKQFRYTGFKLEKKPSGQVELGTTFRTDLIGGYAARVTPRRFEDRKVEFQVEIVRGEKREFSATVRVQAGESQLFGGQPLDEGDALILAVSVR